LRQVRPGDFDPDGGLDAGSQHVDPGLDRHGPGVVQAGNLDRGIQSVHEFVRGAAAMGQDFAVRIFDVHGRPFRFGLEHDGGFDHVERGGVGGTFGPPNFSENVMHFRKAADELVCGLQYFPGFSGGDTRKGGGHVKEVPFIKGRHKLRAEVLVGKEFAGFESPFFRRTIRQQACGEKVPGEEHPNDKAAGGEHDWPAPFNYKINHRMVQPDQQAIDGVLLLWRDFPTNEETHQDRGQGDRQDGCGGH